MLLAQFGVKEVQMSSWSWWDNALGLKKSQKVVHSLVVLGESLSGALPESDILDPKRSLRTPLSVTLLRKLQYHKVQLLVASLCSRKS